MKQPNEFVAYYRVSTARQGESGLGLEAQQARVTSHVASVKGGLVAAFTEIESGKRVTRPQLELAIAAAVEHKATLIVAKLDRLARNTRYLLKILDSGVPFTFCDMPVVPDGGMGRFIITQMASIAELESAMISERTKAALAASTKRLGTHGRVLARRRRAEANERARSLRDLVSQRGANLIDMTVNQAAAYLNNSQISTYSGVPWKFTTARRLLARIRDLD